MGNVIRLLSAILLGGALVAAGAFFAGVWRAQSAPKNFDECMIAEMRDVDATLLENVRAVCERRFAVEFMRLPRSGEWSWDEVGGTVSLILLPPFGTEFTATRANVEVSSKQCEESVPRDFHDVNLYAIGEQLTGYTLVANATCMKLESVWVKRR